MVLLILHLRRNLVEVPIGAVQTEAGALGQPAVPHTGGPRSGP